MIRIPGGGYFGAQKIAQKRKGYNEFIKKPIKKQRIKE